jgi:hypothetical protein
MSCGEEAGGRAGVDVRDQARRIPRAGHPKPRDMQLLSRNGLASDGTSFGPMLRTGSSAASQYGRRRRTVRARRRWES